MITFGYKNKFSSILRACSAIGIGLVMVVATNATVTVTKIIAAFLFVAGVVAFVRNYRNRESGMIPLSSISAVVDILLGLLLYAFPEQIADFIPNLVGVALLIFGALQAIVLFGTMSLVGAGSLSMILSLVALVGGVLLVFSPFSLALMKVLAGFFLLIYGASELLSISRVSQAQSASQAQYGRQDAGYSQSESATAETETVTGGGVKFDTSGISDAKEVDFIEEQ